MIRVLHVVGNMDFGGVETLLMSLFRTIDRSVIQFDFLCHNDVEGKFDPEIGELGGRVFRIPGLGASSLNRYQRSLRDAFDRLDHQIVHSHLSRMNGIVLRQARHAGVPIRISHSHAHNARYDLLRNALRSYSRSLIEASATHGLACSTDAAQFVHRGRLLRDTRILPNAIDTAKFSFSEERRARVRGELGLDGCCVLGHVGRFEHQKNHRHLIEAFQRVHEANRSARLLLVGVGSLEREVRQDVQDRGLEDVVSFLGPRSDVRDLMDAMDVFVFPSLFEGLGIVAVEAQAMGLPVLASEAVPRETKLTDLIRYLPLGDPAPWVDAITAVSSDSRDRQRGGYGDSVAAGGYEIRQVARELQDFYVSAVAALPTNGRAL